MPGRNLKVVFYINSANDYTIRKFDGETGDVVKNRIQEDDPFISHQPGIVILHRMNLFS